MPCDRRLVSRRRRLQEMLTITKRFKRFVLFCITLTLIGLAIGCESFPESMFELASESRLPKWIALPAGMTRKSGNRRDFHQLPAHRERRNVPSSESFHGNLRCPEIGECPVCPRILPNSFPFAFPVPAFLRILLPRILPNSDLTLTTTRACLNRGNVPSVLASPRAQI